MTKLHLSPELSLPTDAVTQTLAFLARKGGGKTYAASLLAEQMLDAGAQVVVMDVVGVWYGLRLAADGKRRGKDIYIIGGDHGDLPLTPESGERLARLVVEKNISAVFDISAFRKGDRQRFCTAFAEELFHRKKSQRSPMHLFLEEAQKLVPQQPQPDERRMLGAFEDIVRLGRNYGIGATMISQRPQSINKEVLSQVECLICLQVNGVHERKAIEEWVREAGADRELVGQLPGLKVGEAYVWSPSWLRIFKRVSIGKKTTFDASATPEVGKALTTGKLSPMDVKGLKAEMTEIVEQAEKDDPVALRRRIAQLEREAKQVPKPAATPAPSKSDLKSLERAAKMIENAVERMTEGKATIEAALMSGKGLLDGIRACLDPMNLNKLPPTGIGRPDYQCAQDALNRHASQALNKVAAVQKPSKVDGSLTGPEQRILDAIAWFEAIGIPDPSSVAVAFLADYSPHGGAYLNPRGALRQRGLIEYRGQDLSLTDTGRALANPPGTHASNGDLHSHVMGRLPGPEQKLLRALLDVYPESLSDDVLASRTNYAPGGGAFLNPKGRLRSLGLITYPHSKHARAADLLFPL